LPAGHVLRSEDLALKSPGDGLPPYELDNVVGRTLRHPHKPNRRPTSRRSRTRSAQQQQNKNAACRHKTVHRHHPYDTPPRIRHSDATPALYGHCESAIKLSHTAYLHEVRERLGRKGAASGE